MERNRDLPDLIVNVQRATEASAPITSGTSSLYVYESAPGETLDLSDSPSILTFIPPYVWDGLIYEYYDTGADYGWIVTDTMWAAQTFTPAINHTITVIYLQLYRTGLPGTVTVSIRATDVFGHPTGPDLCSALFDGNALAGSPQWYGVVLGAGFPLLAWIKYAIVVRSSSGGWDLRWESDVSAASYAGGNIEWSPDSGGTWTTDATFDFMFKEAGGASPVMRWSFFTWS